MINKIKATLHINPHKTLHSTFNGTHALYFGAAFMEGHGVYMYAAGILGILTIANWFIHFE